MSTFNAQASAALLDLMAERGITQAAVTRHLGRKSTTYVNQRVRDMYPLTFDIVGAVADLAHLAPAAIMEDIAARIRR